MENAFFEKDSSITLSEDEINLCFSVAEEKTYDEIADVTTRNCSAAVKQCLNFAVLFQLSAYYSQTGNPDRKVLGELLRNGNLYSTADLNRQLNRVKIKIDNKE